MSILKLTSIFLLLLAIISCNNKSSSPESPEVSQISQTLSQNNNIRIKTVYGDIIFKLLADKAPNTAVRIAKLVQEGFYDGLSFHRVVPGFVIQGGDPTGTGRGGSGKKLKAEFNDISHVKGTVAMARSQHINSADSQFYIALGPQPHLDGKYTVFGQVIDGLEVLEKIKVGDKMLTVTLEEK